MEEVFYCMIEEPDVIEEPACPYGYTEGQLACILGDRLPEFRDWFYGQTGMICITGEYNSCEVSHGFVVYTHDLEQFLSGGRPLD